MESFFSGCDGWLTGIEALDAQHVELAACINSLLSACCGHNNTQSGDSVADKRDLFELVDHLYRKTKAHFAFEEAVMQEAEYPDFADHQREHIMLLAELKLVLNMGSGAGGCKLDPGMAGQLKTWFLAHIRHSDNRFSAYVCNHMMTSKLNTLSPD